jgi:hypothetical protein
MGENVCRQCKKNQYSIWREKQIATRRGRKKKEKKRSTVPAKGPNDRRGIPEESSGSRRELPVEGPVDWKGKSYR